MPRLAMNAQGSYLAVIGYLPGRKARVINCEGDVSIVDYSAINITSGLFRPACIKCKRLMMRYAF